LLAALTSVELDIAIHSTVDTFDIVNKTVYTSVHNSAFITIQRCHCTRNEIRTNYVLVRFRYGHDTHTHVYRFVELRFEFAHFYRDQVLGKNASTMKV